MKNISFFGTIGVAICLVLFSSCSAEDGADGAIGPQGEQGIQGEPGANGNANVIASEWLDVSFTPLIRDVLTATLMDDRITTAMTNNSVFLLYGRNGATQPESTVSIPFTEPILGVSFYYILDTSIGELEILGVSLDGSTPTVGVINQVRFVIIPSGTNSLSQENPTYGELVKQLGLDYGD
ncbi:hypothetical protein [Flagellimonas flava]|uniref:Collagen triple helix repeat-containing protein n=1 Tax=Flagellimonas flava TaxID=570519 RepID=A0A1M5IP59_9FLAO|nr:hypothetical protein [Allomuricauda flava]SHG30031.1 hypothetical protein SAMN04488116_0838 [Allomuricauda flava]